MRSIEELNKAAKESRDAFGIRGEYHPECTIKVYMGEEGLRLGSEEIVKDVIKELESRQKFTAAVELVPFDGKLEQMPIMEIHDSHGRIVKYGNLDKEKIRKIIVEHVMFGKVVAEYQIDKEEC